MGTEDTYVTSRRGFFWVGVNAVASPFGTVAKGQMYVEWESPKDRRHPWPLVLVHGGGGQGTDWLGTPDGRPGWAHYLVREGYEVYVVDRPGHGRSPYHPDVLGPMSPPMPYEVVTDMFTAPARAAQPYPGAPLHTQWPGSGLEGDPARDQFAASSGPMQVEAAEAQRDAQAAGVELLERIGPAVLMTHSAGGPTGWLVADARPELVKAIVAIEPLGPPFRNAGALSVPWGVTAASLTFDPPAADPADLAVVEHPGPPPHKLQAEPARQLTNLHGIPIVLVTAEASFANQSDPAVVAFLRQAGCTVDHLRLADHGIHGNGHLVVMERNNREALQPILDWLEKTVGSEANPGAR
jgi:pimeloyl-ACP methyl ester carboxylesterase